MNAAKLNIHPMDSFTGTHDYHAGFSTFGFTIGMNQVIKPKWYIQRESNSYAGRVQIGETIEILSRCVPGGKPIQPDLPGVIRIYSPSPGPLPANSKIPVEVTDTSVAGLFHGKFVGDNRHFPGYYFCLVSFLTSGIPRSEVLTFELLTGGHQLGPVLSMAVTRRPDDDACIVHMESGKILDGRGPYLDEGLGGL